MQPTHDKNFKILGRLELSKISVGDILIGKGYHYLVLAILKRLRFAGLYYSIINVIDLRTFYEHPGVIFKSSYLCKRISKVK
jgi:hypothetical protein